MWIGVLAIEGDIAEMFLFNGSTPMIIASHPNKMLRETKVARNEQSHTWPIKKEDMYVDDWLSTQPLHG